jgi:hypothetical protein
MKSMKTLELYCNVVNGLYGIILETVDKVFIFVDCREVCYDIMEHGTVNSRSEVNAMISATNSHEGSSRKASSTYTSSSSSTSASSPSLLRLFYYAVNR